MFSNRRCGLAPYIVLLVLAFLVGSPFALPQAVSLVHSSVRSAGNGSSLFNGDFGSAATVSLNSPSYIVFDSYGNQFISDTLNNCVRKIDGHGNVTTVAGLVVPGQGDTCNTSSTSIPTASQGLYEPAGLAIDSTNRLYIADTMHNCIRALAANTTGTANLVTVVGRCGSVPTDSVTPQPNGITLDSTGNLYVSLQDSVSSIPVNQVVRHSASDGPVSACLIAGTPSSNVPARCPGVTNGIKLQQPSGLAYNITGDLYIADTGNNCVRKIAGLATRTPSQSTAVGQCLNDGSGSSATAIRNPYGLAVSPQQSILISESNPDNIVSFTPGNSSVVLIGGLPGGTAGAYDSLQDGKSAVNAPLHGPRGIAFDGPGHIFIADSQNNITRELNTNLLFPDTPVGSPSSAQPVTLAIHQAVNLTITAGSDYSITSTTCAGTLAAAPSGTTPNTCQIFVRFVPTRPGLRRSPLTITDSVSGTSLSQGMQAVGTGALNLFTPGTSTVIASGLTSPASVTTDAAGVAFVLESASATHTADVRSISAGVAAASVLLPASLGSPAAMASDAAGNWFVADSAHGSISRFGADGTIDAAFITGLDTPVSLSIDLFGNLYIAQAGRTNNVILAYASGVRRAMAGGGTISSTDGVTATSAAFVSLSAITLDLHGVLYVADQGAHRVYAVDSNGVLHVVAGNGTTVSTQVGQAKSTALVEPDSLAVDAAGDLYIADASGGIVHTVYTSSSSASNMVTTYDAGTPATSNAPLSIALDGSGNLFVANAATGTVVEVTYGSPTLYFGSVQTGTTSATKMQSLVNVGTDDLDITSPFSTTDSHFAIDSGATTCGTRILSGSMCSLGFSFTPTASTIYNAASILNSNSFNTPQPVSLTGSGKQTTTATFSLDSISLVYGQPLSAAVHFGSTTPVPSGTVTLLAGSQGLCTLTGNFAAAMTCTAPAAGLAAGIYPVTANYSGDSNYAAATSAATLTVLPASTVTLIASSLPTAAPGTSVTFTATVAVANQPAGGIVTFYDGAAVMAEVNLGAGGLATFTTRNLSPGVHSISATYRANTNFVSSTATVSETITQAAGSFTVRANQDAGVIVGAGSTTYSITVSSTGAFAGQIALTCNGMPADATCSFGSPMVTLSPGSSVTTTMTVATNGLSAKLESPVGPANSASLAPMTTAAFLPVEITGLFAFFAGIGRRKILGTQKVRALVLVAFTLVILGLTGCGSSMTPLKTYTISIFGTSVTFPAPVQTTTVVLSVGQK